MHNHETGEQVLRNGKPVPRVPGVKLPCEMSEGQPDDVRARACAKISPTSGIELNERNQQALEHYLRCRAVGKFPDDELVAEHAAIIRSIMDAHEASRLSQSIISAIGYRR